jgi:hypothetical protein
MKRLANLKSSSSDSPNPSGKKNHVTPQPKTKKAGKNNPYPESSVLDGDGVGKGHLSFGSPVTPRSKESFTSAEDAGVGHRQALAKSNKSTAPTVATNSETVNSGRSKAETGNATTLGGGSTFSSPSHSERSLTTTLTTIQSSAPSNVLGQLAQTSPAPTVTPVQFSHQFPSPPASAIPPHLAPQPQTNSYQTATANNILTDNASILTLASSSKRRRRNSLDTNASVRALAPSSVFGGSRESLPLSVLSGNADNSTIYNLQNRPGGFSSAERASVYSASGVAAPALSSERNSYYANKQGADGMSVRSGLLGHGRTESITGSIGANPLASPRDIAGPGKLHRRSSEWKELGDGSEDEDDDTTAIPPIIESESGEKAAVLRT